MVHRTDFRRRRLREAALIIAFTCAALLLCVSVELGLWDVLLLCVSVELGLWDIAQALWHLL